MDCMPFAAGVVSLVAVTAAAAPQIDMAQVQKWSKAETVHYHIDAVYDGWTIVSPRWGLGEVQATDSLKLDFDWDIRKRTLIGDVKYSNGGSSTKATRSAAPECPAPSMPSGYEHFNAASAKQDFDARIEIKGTRTYGEVNAPLECPASLKLIRVPGSAAEVTEYVPVPEPMMLAVGETGNSNISIGKDKKTFVVKANGWTWTYTPTLIK